MRKLFKDILFRAKRINRKMGREYRSDYQNGDWVYGVPTRAYDDMFPNLPAEMTDMYGISGIDIDDTTLGQWTGKVDKKGREVFEGDILFYDRDNESLYLVVWSSYYASFEVEAYCEGKLKYSGGAFPSEYNGEWWVVGNIHDNPELLEVNNENTAEN